MADFKRSFQRWLMGIPRSFFPVINLGSRTFIFRFEDVVEVLRRDKDFTLREVNYEHIARHIGPFILGMDDGPEYQRDVGVLRGAVEKEDVGRIQSYLRRACTEAAAGLSGEFDLVKAYTRKIPWQLQAEYFGVPGPDMESMWRWNRALFWDIFLDLSGNEEIRANAVQSAQEMNAYLANLIAERKAIRDGGKGLADTFLDRLVAAQAVQGDFMTDKWISGNLSGVYMGGLEPANKAVCNVLGVWWKRPAIWSIAQTAAAADDIQQIAGMAWEAMRFHPNAPLLMRYSAKEQFIGGNGRKKRRIKAGKTIFAMSYAGMFDPRALDAPKEFRDDRALDRYLYFGYGLHQCFGNYINRVSIPEMLMALLKIKDLKPKSGKAGKVVNEGPFPDSWMWTR